MGDHGVHGKEECSLFFFNYLEYGATSGGEKLILEVGDEFGEFLQGSISRLRPKVAKEKRYVIQRLLCKQREEL